MKDFYIEWKEICKCIERICDCVEDADFDVIKGMFLDAQAVTDVRPVVRGRWKVTPIYIKCSECGECFMLIPQNYCPNCGADMREDETCAVWTGMKGADG